MCVCVCVWRVGACVRVWGCGWVWWVGGWVGGWVLGGWQVSEVVRWVGWGEVGEMKWGVGWR